MFRVWHKACFPVEHGMYVLLPVLAIYFVSGANSAGGEFTNEFAIHIKVASLDVDELTAEAARYHLQHVKQVVPNVHLYKDVALPRISSPPTSFPELQSFFRHQIEIQQLEHFDLRHDPEPVMPVGYSYPEDTPMNLVCQPYYDMGVEHAWALGYTGSGVVVGVVDMGVNTQLVELAANINKEHSYNVMQGNHDVEPTPHSNYPEYDVFLDHGNRCAGLIAGVKDNNLCSCGVAPDSSLAALKVFSITDDAIRYGKPYHFSPASVANGNIYRHNEIHIYSNSWGPNDHFITPDMPTREAFKYGVAKGRRGKGSIYVFPAGSAGNSYTNSIHTIAVGGLGVNGAHPRYTKSNACTLTSAYGEGNKLNATYLVTASFHSPPCTRDFSGTSASTAIVAGIVALALHANDKLTWRDVQHLIVNSSQHTGLQTSDEFRINGAGKHFHDYFGFGLLRADDMVNGAKDWKPVTGQVICQPSHTAEHRQHRSTGSISRQYIPVQCCHSSTPRMCIHHVEHVVITISFQTHDVSGAKLELMSPSGTISRLVQRPSGHHVGHHVITTELLSVNFWGENPHGTWMVTLEQETGPGDYSIHDVDLLLYGTSIRSADDITETAPTNSPVTPSTTADISSTVAATSTTTVTASVTATSTTTVIASVTATTTGGQVPSDNDGFPVYGYVLVIVTPIVAIITTVTIVYMYRRRCTDLLRSCGYTFQNLWGRINLAFNHANNLVDIIILDDDLLVPPAAMHPP